MKFDFKSFLIGGLACGLLVSILSASPGESTDHLEFAPSAIGMSIYNRATNTLYVYPMWGGKISSTPKQKFKLAPDGSKLDIAE